MTDVKRQQEGLTKAHQIFPRVMTLALAQNWIIPMHTRLASHMA